MKPGQTWYLRKSEADSYYPYTSSEIETLPHGTVITEVRVVRQYVITHEVKLMEKRRP